MILEKSPEKAAELAKKEVTRVSASVKGWVEGDALDVAQYVLQPVDHVVIANTFHGVPDKTGLASVVRKTLKPDGRFAIVNWHKQSKEKTPVLGKPRGPRTGMRMSPDDVRAVVEPAGFELQDVIELLPYHYGAVFRRSNSFG